MGKQYLRLRIQRHRHRKNALVTARGKENMSFLALLATDIVEIETVRGKPNRTFCIGQNFHKNFLLPDISKGHHAQSRQNRTIKLLNLER